MGMPGLGTLINMGMILAGSLVGMLIGKGVPDRFSKIIFQALGAATFLIGLSGVFTGMLQVGEGGALESSYTLLLILSLAVGGIVGELLRLDRLFDKAGEAIKNRFGGKAGEREVGAGFANCTILFCAGAMAIVGSVQDGLLGDPTMLIAKGMLDGIMSVLFATVYGLVGVSFAKSVAYGLGVPLSALSVGLYQGAVTLLAVLIKPYLTDLVVTQMSLVGSAVLMLIAFNLWDVKKFNVANLIPAAFMPLLFSLFQGVLGRL